jgi:hypothetical protein
VIIVAGRCSAQLEFVEWFDTGLLRGGRRNGCGVCACLAFACGKVVTFRLQMRIREELRPEEDRTPGMLQDLIAKMEVHRFK